MVTRVPLFSEPECVPFSGRGAAAASLVRIIPEEPSNDMSSGAIALTAANSAIQSPSPCFFFHSSLYFTHASLHNNDINVLLIACKLILKHKKWFKHCLNTLTLTHQKHQRIV